jgi:hypothetical protein
MALNAWMAKVIVRLDNVENVALHGACIRMVPYGNPQLFLQYRRCTDATETRGSWIEHLWFGLTD